ncbi:MAG: hypothetical protein VZQ83_08755, partial [Eubacterium sp.]|nr:hypothetical protein [Eubacterium sp.]
GEELKGLSYYDFLCEVDDHFDDYKDNLVEVLTWLRDVIFTRDRLLINVITTPEGYEVFEKAAPTFTAGLAEGSAVPAPVHDSKQWNDMYAGAAQAAGAEAAPRAAAPHLQYEIKPIPKNEGITTAGNVQYVARVGNYKKAGIAYHGSFRVLKTILSYEYLWNEVRVKGGAYGVMCAFSHTGNGFMVSYRDPHLRETVDVYRTVADYLRDFDVEERDMVKFIIGTVRSMDAPLTPRAEGSRSFDHYMNGITNERLQQTRDEVLSTTKEDIRRTAAMIDAVLADNYICVVGNEARVNECKDMFDSIRQLQ